MCMSCPYSGLPKLPGGVPGAPYTETKEVTPHEANHRKDQGISADEERWRAAANLPGDILGTGIVGGVDANPCTPW